MSLLALAVPVWLGAQRYNFEYYSHADGLGGMEVRSLLQDRTGFIWIGATPGLYRYDGKHFRAYTQADGLPAAPIEALHEMADGTLLAGTRKGIARLDGERFRAVPIPGTPAIMSQSGLASDRLGRLYAATSEGLYIAAGGARITISGNIRTPRRLGVRPHMASTSTPVMTPYGLAAAWLCVTLRRIE